MNKIKDLFIPNENNNYSPIVSRSVSIFVFALVVLFFNISYSGGIGQVQAAVSISDIVDLHNRERQARGLGPLVIDSKLNYSAQQKAEAMLGADCWSHYCPDGKSPWDFFDDADYTYVFAGENLAHGFYDSETAMIAWMNSPTHRANVLKPDFEELGVGIAYGDFQGKRNNIVITVHFGSEVNDFSNDNIIDNTAGEDDTNIPEIISPEEGEFVNDTTPSIIGDSRGATNIEVLNYDSVIGEVPVNGGIFTYRPENSFDEGEQSITIRSFVNGQTIGVSSPRKFTIDTKVPTVIDNQVIAEDINTNQHKSIILSLEVSERISKGHFIIDNVKYEFLNSGEMSWKSEVLLDSINSTNEVEVFIEDLAGNSNQFSITKDQVLGLNEKVQLANNSEITIETEQDSGNFLGLSDKRLKSQINLLFILISVAVIAIDIIAARQTGLTGFEGKPHFHFSNFAVLLLVILIGGINGQLLEGINISL